MSTLRAGSIVCLVVLCSACPQKDEPRPENVVAQTGAAPANIVGRVVADAHSGEVVLVLRHWRAEPRSHIGIYCPIRTWGYDKIQGTVENLGHVISATSVANILKRHGIVPAPERGKTSSWRTFLQAHWQSIAACGFFTAEVWTPRGLVTIYTFLVIHLATRRVEIAGTTPSPDGIFMAQIAKNLTDPVDGFLVGKHFLIRDNDGKFSGGFDGILKDEGIDVVRTPYKAPNANAYAERFVRTIKHECLNRMIFFGIAPLRRAQREFLAHYHRERNHQRIANAIIEPGDEVGSTAGKIECEERLGGMLRYYRRAA